MLSDRSYIEDVYYLLFVGIVARQLFALLSYINSTGGACDYIDESKQVIVVAIKFYKCAKHRNYLFLQFTKSLTIYCWTKNSKHFFLVKIKFLYLRLTLLFIFFFSSCITMQNLFASNMYGMSSAKKYRMDIVSSLFIFSNVKGILTNAA